jgi:hypothetical protein
VAGMFMRYYLELPPAARVGAGVGPGAQPGVEKDFLDQLGHAIVLSHLGPAARMRP